MKLKSIVLLLVLFMLVGGFSIVPYILQAGFYNPGRTNPVEVPTADIVDHELTVAQEDAILRQGKAIIRFEYSLGCEGCPEAQRILENLVNSNQFKGKMVLEEIKSSGNDLPRVEIIGFSVSQGQLGVAQNVFQGANVTEATVVNSLCNLLLEPPVGCALRKV